MQTMLQLNPPLPMRTPKGEGMAVLVIDYGPDFDLFWTVMVSKGEHAGEIWTYPNPQVRGVDNITLGRHPVPTDVDRHPEPHHKDAQAVSPRRAAERVFNPDL